jgi:hypothetical protein
MTKPATGISYSALFRAYQSQPLLKGHTDVARHLYTKAEERVQYVYNAVMRDYNRYDRARMEFLCSVIGGCHGAQIEIPPLLTGSLVGSGEYLNPERLNRMEEASRRSPREPLR